MAHWPNRSDSYLPPGVLPPPSHPPPPPPPVALHSGSTPSKANLRSATAPATSTTRQRPPIPRRVTNTKTTQLTPFDVVDGSQLEISSSSDEDHHHRPSRPTRPNHGRSMSHPFPSLFLNKKRHPQPQVDGADSDSSDDIPIPPPKTPSRSQQPQAPQTHRRMGPNSGSKDFASGTCMTCGSLVRWPRELQVFRCVICATINDLQPLAVDERKDLPPLGTDGPDDGFPQASPISLDHTRALITQCLREFLQTALNDYVIHEPTYTPHLTRDQEKRRRSQVYSTPGSRVGSEAHLAVEGYGKNPAMSSPSLLLRPGKDQRSLSTSYPESRPVLHDMTAEKAASKGKTPDSGPDTDSKQIFKRLDDYITASLSSFDAINSSFISERTSSRVAPSMDPGHRRPTADQPKESLGEIAARGPNTGEQALVDLDPKLLLLGDFAENGSWWTGRDEYKTPARETSKKTPEGPSLVSHRSPYVNWEEVDAWYEAVTSCARSWRDVYNDMVKTEKSWTAARYDFEQIEMRLLQAQDHTQKNLLKAVESILKRPGRPLTRPSDLRCFLILLANPLLYASNKTFEGNCDHPSRRFSHARGEEIRSSGPVSGQHSGVIKRLLGLISTRPADLQGYLISWFSKCPEPRFMKLKDLVGGFLAYRLRRQHEKKYETKVDLTKGLIPNIVAGQSVAMLHDELRPNTSSNKKRQQPPKKQVYHDDWQIRAAAQVMALIFNANNVNCSRKNTLSETPSAQNEGNGMISRLNVQARGQILPTSDFYNSLLDEMDLVADFEAWGQRKGKFAFCQYPFLLSIWAKIQILEYDTRRQMQVKARDAFFDSILSRGAQLNPHLVLEVRRDCLVEDSLKAVSEVIGSGSEDIKKALRIVFKGEEGVDVGGIRKEWFLLLVREVFNHDHGMFIYDEDSNYCYFNPNSFETSDQYFLIGVVFGLAIYNSTILDVAFPPFAFRKLLLAAPPGAAASAALPRPVMQYTLDDLAQYRPRLAKGFRQLLDYDGDVETFSLDFVVDVDKYGTVDHVPLCPGGQNRPVTNANRREYVDLYVRYLLDTSVTRQFEPFKRGFFTVCGGNALSLFRAEEIELLVRGSDEALDIAALRTSAVYDNWPSRHPDQEETIQWFWKSFEAAPPRDQRKLLLFITGSDRIPAMGAASLTIRIVYLGDEDRRFPSARTCFNQLALYRYRSRNTFERMLWTAVQESEGFGLK